MHAHTFKRKQGNPSPLQNRSPPFEGKNRERQSQVKFRPQNATLAMHKVRNFQTLQNIHALETQLSHNKDGSSLGSPHPKGGGGGERRKKMLQGDKPRRSKMLVNTPLEYHSFEGDTE